MTNPLIEIESRKMKEQTSPKQSSIQLFHRNMKEQTETSSIQTLEEAKKKKKKMKFNFNKLPKGN